MPARADAEIRNDPTNQIIVAVRMAGVEWAAIDKIMMIEQATFFANDAAKHSRFRDALKGILCGGYVSDFFLNCFEMRPVAGETR